VSDHSEVDHSTLSTLLGTCGNSVMHEQFDKTYIIGGCYWSGLRHVKIAIALALCAMQTYQYKRLPLDSDSSSGKVSDAEQIY